jgi:phosphoglycerate dehydrogenase-like enzyme
MPRLLFYTLFTNYMADPEIIIFSAKGRESLSHLQQKAVEETATVQYIANLSPLSDDRLIQLCQTANYIGLTRRTCTDFHAKIIRSLPHLKGISVYTTGIEWIDLVELQTCNIALKFLPDYSAITVAEHAIGLLLTLSRRIHLSDRKAMSEISSSVSLRGWELSGKKIGILGLGRIGSRIAHLAKAFNMKVSYYDPKIEIHPEFSAVSFEQIIQQSDVVMLAASLNRESPIIITNKVLAAMQQGVYIINPARPALVDNPAIISAIQSGKVAGYAVDDNPFSLDELRRLEAGRILQTGHTGWYSDEAMERGTEMWINNLVELAKNNR